MISALHATRFTKILQAELLILCGLPLLAMWAQMSQIPGHDLPILGLQAILNWGGGAFFKGRFFNVLYLIGQPEGRR